MKEYHKYRNLLFASISSPQDTTVDKLINGILNETNNKKSVTVNASDIFEDYDYSYYNLQSIKLI